MGTSHTCIGQEGVAVGVLSAALREDAVTTTHRGHGHLLARGGDPKRMMAELFGHASGYSQGKGGSQMMMDPFIGFYGSNGITGGSIPFATGLALEAKLHRKPRVTICFFGDGASNQGVFHESLNMAALWELPIMYVVENNGYAMSTTTKNGVSIENIADRAAAYNIKGITTDGNQVEELYQCTSELLSQIRAGAGPCLLECKTYRLSGHSRGDPRVYRTREEEECAWQEDPIARLGCMLLKRDIATQEELAQIDTKTRAQITAAVEYAASDSPLDPTNAITQLFAPDNRAG